MLCFWMLSVVDCKIKKHKVKECNMLIYYIVSTLLVCKINVMQPNIKTYKVHPVSGRCLLNLIFNLEAVVCAAV